MDKIEEFMNGEIGIDINLSKEEDINELWDIISHNYPVRIKPDSNPEDARFYNLVIYFDSVKNTEWEVCLFDNDYNCFNAYAGETAKMFKEKHVIYSAADLLKNKYHRFGDVKIKEADVMSLFGV